MPAKYPGASEFAFARIACAIMMRLMLKTRHTMDKADDDEHAPKRIANSDDARHILGHQ